MILNPHSFWQAPVSPVFTPPSLLHYSLRWLENNISNWDISQSAHVSCCCLPNLPELSSVSPPLPFSSFHSLSPSFVFPLAELTHRSRCSHLHDITSHGESVMRDERARWLFRRGGLFVREVCASAVKITFRLLFLYFRSIEIHTMVVTHDKENIFYRSIFLYANKISKDSMIFNAIQRSRLLFKICWRLSFLIPLINMLFHVFRQSSLFFLFS